MTLLEKKYLLYCEDKKIEILNKTSAELFINDLSDEDFEKILKQYRLDFDPRGAFNFLFVPIFDRLYSLTIPIFYLSNLNHKDDLSISERSKAIEEVEAPFISQHTLGHLKRNDFVATSLFLTECLRAAEYKTARHNVLHIFKYKYKNYVLANFFDAYIKIFSFEEIDPDKDFIPDNFGSFGFLADVLYFLYCLREKLPDEVQKTLDSLKKSCPEIYYLFGLGFCSIKVDITHLPTINDIKTFGLINPNDDRKAYTDSLRKFILFIKLSCDYSFRYFYEFEKSYSSQTVKLLSEQINELTIQERLLSISIMYLSLRELEPTGNTIKIKIADLKKFIDDAAKYGGGDIDKESFVYITEHIESSVEMITQTLEDLECHGFISDLNFDEATFVPEDLLFVFTNVFGNSLMQMVKTNKDLLETEDLDLMSVKNVLEDDSKDHES